MALAQPKYPLIFSEFLFLVKKLQKVKSDYESSKVRGRIKRLFTSDDDYYVFSKIPINSRTVFYLDDRDPNNPYVLIMYSNVTERKSYWGYENRVENKRACIIGVNDDNKLFCNLLDYDIAESSIIVNDYENGKFDHLRLLGYDIDYDQPIPISTVERETFRFRVQGDLIFEVEKVSLNEVRDMYKTIITNFLLNRIFESVRRLFIRRIIEELMKRRISCNIRNNSVIVETTNISYWKREDYCDILRKFAYYVHNKHIKKYGVTCESVSVIGLGIFGANVTQFTITPYLMMTNSFRDLFLEHYSNFIDEIVDRALNERTEREIRFGNHVVRALAYPSEIHVRFFNFVTDQIEDLEITLEQNMLVTDEEITIDHDEHKPRVVKFLREKGYVYIIRFDNTHVSDREALIRNRFLLNKLMKDREIRS